MAVRYLGGPQVECFIGRGVIAGVVQCLCIVPERRRAPSRRMCAGKPRGGFGKPPHPVIDRPCRHRRIGALFERERLLERAQGLVLPKHHLQCFAEQHPGIGVIGETNARLARGVHGAPAVLDYARQVHESRVEIGVAGRHATAEPQPGDRPLGRLTLGGRSPTGAEARECGAQGAEHCLIMGKATVRLQRRMTRVAGLKGRRIVVTRAREQAGELIRALEDHGAETVLAPVIRIQPLENLGPLRAALTGLSAYRWVVFTSQNAVQIVLDRLVAWGLTPRVFASTSIAAVGSSTADMLKQRGLIPALVPDEFVAEALVEALDDRSDGDLAGSRVLIPSAEDARDVLVTGLRQRGATVESIPVYRTVPVRADFSGLTADLAQGRLDAVTFTSSSTVRSFVDLVGRDVATSGRFVTATIGPITAKTASELGLRDITEAIPHTVAGLVESLVRRFA